MDTLIVAPHMDDEVFGCASFLQDSPSSVLVLYVTNDHALVDATTLQNENADLVKWLGCRTQQYVGHHANFLDCTRMSVLIDAFQRTFNDCRPRTVLLPNASYNQDHRAVYDAALTALRPHDRNHFVKRILLYEQPETWGTLRQPSPFEPNYFRKLDLNYKFAAMGFYKSQIRGHRTPEHTTHIAGMRGMQSNMEYAEAFQVVRWVE